MLIALLLLLAPDDPAQMLKVAWASQYEWKEDDVKSATIDFTYTREWGEKAEFKRTGQGQLVVVGDAIVRRHYPEATDLDTRRFIDGHVDWVLGRFIRRPFEEAFKDAKFEGPEKSAYDQMKVTVGGRAFYVKDDRIVAAESGVAIGERTILVRADYRHADLGGGYAIVGESDSSTSPFDSTKVTRERTLTTRMTAERPAPATYTFEEKSARGKELVVFDFHAIRFDLPDPVTLDPKARDVLKEAWARRFVMPEEIRIQGQFQRSIDKDLDRAGWRSDVQGDFQVWGMGSIQVSLDEGEDRTREQCEKDVRWIFGQFRDTPFDKEFEGCGFELEPQGDDSVVRIYGYPGALAFRISNGVITGHYDKILSEAGWWTYKTRAAGEGRFQIENMKRVEEVEGRKIQLDFDYQRVRGHQIPKKVGVFCAASSQRGGTAVGVAEYAFRKAKVSFPNE
jgi:hypothetical protein